jgi:hypothetical protein
VKLPAILQCRGRLYFQKRMKQMQIRSIRFGINKKQNAGFVLENMIRKIETMFLVGSELATTLANMLWEERWRQGEYRGVI